MQINDTKLNSYTLPERAKARMILKLDNTKQKELGFALCSKPDNIIVEGQDIEIKEAEDNLRSDIIKRDVVANKVIKEIENESKKYYNEVEIKLRTD